MRAPHRRDFLRAVLAAGAALPSLHAIEPIARTGKPNLKLSLAAYSYNRHLNLRQKKPTMTLEEFIDVGGKLELPAVELTAYYFPKTSKEYLAAVKERCTRLGL